MRRPIALHVVKVLIHHIGQAQVITRSTAVYEESSPRLFISFYRIFVLSFSIFPDRCRPGVALFWDQPCLASAHGLCPPAKYKSFRSELPVIAPGAWHWQPIGNIPSNLLEEASGSERGTLVPKLQAQVYRAGVRPQRVTQPFHDRNCLLAAFTFIVGHNA
jgi:hypothetical protein